MIYNIFIYCYLVGVKVASIFNPKARLWVAGRKNLFPRLEDALALLNQDPDKKLVWFHCASLGEFEQGRPVIESFRIQHPEFKILLTFFSPSGYEIRKKYKEADFIFYLPADTRKNAERFISLVRPQMAFFVKYDFWYNLLRELNREAIPVYFISAIFRGDQYFFHWYGSWFRNHLQKVNWFFVQDAESVKLLADSGIASASITGDTRFDRVKTVIDRPHKFPLVERFTGDSKVVIGGSTWPLDEKMLNFLIQNRDGKTKFIIAPHETGSERIASLIASLPLPSLKYSQLTPDLDDQADILVIDTIGILAHLYQYATIAYIGGGFGSGIHNVLEAAGFGVPVIFGPNYSAFKEAKELISEGGGFSIQSSEELKVIANELLTNQQAYSKAASSAGKYVQRNIGATDKIMKKING